MLTPVLIPARNEAEHIGRTLQALPVNVEPIVIVNGCRKDDTTAEIASFYGARVLESLVEGKMPALQTANYDLGSRANEPFITLDADTYPMFTHNWLEAMLRACSNLDYKKPAAVVGPLVFGVMNLITGSVRSLIHFSKLYRTREKQREGNFSGSNMLLDLRNQHGVDAILGLGNYWPGDDKAIKDKILSQGGAVIKTPDLHAFALTDGIRWGGFMNRLIKGRTNYQMALFDTYLAEAPPHSIPYL